jgi:hypothetical protein
LAVTRFASKLTYANVMATMALFLALGGVGYAATKLPKDSVGTAQLKKGAVTPAKLSKPAKAAPAGPAGPRGEQGVAGTEGAPGKNLTAETPLPSGATETGDFSTAGGGAPAFLSATANFVQPLATGLDEEHVVFVAEGEASAPHCPGVRQAAPGYLCIYIVKSANSSRPNSGPDPETGRIGAGRSGAVLFFAVPSADEASFALGNWAVTAP